MESLEPLPPADRLYDYRPADGGSVPLWLPYGQGDVFAGVDLPGVPNEASTDDGRRLSMLFMHPCTMRSRAGLRSHVTVVRVRRKSKKKSTNGDARWANEFRLMPLPGMYTDSAHYADFMALATVPATDLSRAGRVTALSATGRCHMVQRITYHLSRHAPDVATFAEATRAVETEMENQADWVQAGLRNDGSDCDESDVNALEAEYDAYIGQARDDGVSLRKMLNSDRAPEVVREIQLEIQRRSRLQPPS